MLSQRTLSGSALIWRARARAAAGARGAAGATSGASDGSPPAPAGPASGAITLWPIRTADAPRPIQKALHAVRIKPSIVCPHKRSSCQRYVHADPSTIPGFDPFPDCQTDGHVFAGTLRARQDVNAAIRDARKAPVCVLVSTVAMKTSPSVGAVPFALTAGRDDTALYQDARSGFSHLLPGRPVLGMPAHRPGDPPADAVVHLQDAPVTIRYRLEPPTFQAASAAELARGTAERFAGWRAQATVAVDWANESWLSAWGVEAAVVAAYDIPASATAAGATTLQREDLFVLVRQGMVMLVSWTYPRGFVDDPAYATFASVGEATMAWDFSRWEQRGRVWPDGAFLGPGLFGAPKSKYHELGKLLSSAPILPDERMQVLAILSGIVSGAGAPWVPLGPEVIDGNKRALLAVVKNARLRALVEEGFAEIRTAHDLRGLAIILGRALDVRRTSSLPPPMPMPASFQRPSAPLPIQY